VHLNTQVSTPSYAFVEFQHTPIPQRKEKKEKKSIHSQKDPPEDQRRLFSGQVGGRCVPDRNEKWRFENKKNSHQHKNTKTKDAFSEIVPSFTDQASATTQYTSRSEVRSAAVLPNSNTPQSEYGLNPASAPRSAGHPPEFPTRPPHYQPAPQHQGVAGSMAQATSPSMSLQDGGPPHDHPPANRVKSDPDVPIDPSIAQQNSPAYPPPFPPYSHQQQQEMNYPNPPGMYRPGPPDWSHPYAHSPGMPPGPYSGPGPNVSSSPATAGSRSSQVSIRSLLVPSFCLSTLLPPGRSGVRVARTKRRSCPTPPRSKVTLANDQPDRSTPLSPFLELSSTSAPGAATRKLSGCTNVGGMDVKRHMAR
jgi:hypothetical protein